MRSLRHSSLHVYENDRDIGLAANGFLIRDGSRSSPRAPTLHQRCKRVGFDPTKHWPCTPSSPASARVYLANPPAMPRTKRGRGGVRGARIDKPRQPHKRTAAATTQDRQPAPSGSANPPSSTNRNSSPRKSRRTGVRPPSHSATLRFLPLSSPKPEHDLPAHVKTYARTIPLSPFEELAAAVIFARPISHALGQRTIRTLFSPPWSLATPAAIRDAGPEKRSRRRGRSTRRRRWSSCGACRAW